MAKCHVRGCTRRAWRGAPCCRQCADHVCTRRCLRGRFPYNYCARVEPVIVRLPR